MLRAILWAKAHILHLEARLIVLEALYSGQRHLFSEPHLRSRGAIAQ